MIVHILVNQTHSKRRGLAAVLPAPIFLFKEDIYPEVKLTKENE